VGLLIHEGQVTDADGRPQTVWFSPSDFTLWTPLRGAEGEGISDAVWTNLADGSTSGALPEGSYQISPFIANEKWDLTTDPLIGVFECDAGNCLPTGEKKVVDASVVRNVRAGMRLAVTESGGTLNRIFTEEYPLPIAVAGKTGTAEYCDDVALEANRCQFGYGQPCVDSFAMRGPQVVILAFEYNRGGASVAGPWLAG
jgi:hypothetical protein